jgi:outer membrane protein TolC
VALPDPATPAQFNTTNSSRYSAGVNVSVSLEQLLNRSHLIQRGKLSYQRTEQLRQERENQIRQQLIPLYQNVLLTKRLLTIQQDAYVSVQTNFQLSEKQFRLGQLTLPEYSQASSMLTSAAVAQEGARSQYETAFMLLEETVGAKISSLMTTTR